MDKNECADYEICIRLFSKELISLCINSETELNGEKPLLFGGFLFGSAALAGLMFASAVVSFYLLTG